MGRRRIMILSSISVSDLAIDSNLNQSYGRRIVELRSDPTV
jgi:hypothetical protein